MGSKQDIKDTLAENWIPNIYNVRVRSDRTRAYSLNVPQKENVAEIQYTLLGIELKVGRRRFACPDLATARYLRVFARIGCRGFAVPYDITRISSVADELEMAWQRSLMLLKGAETVMRSAIVKAMRIEIAAIGPGEPMPLFDRETRQQKT
jgi:hypothetical protein